MANRQTQDQLNTGLPNPGVTLPDDDDPLSDTDDAEETGNDDEDGEEEEGSGAHV